ncbi:hypothetical protein JCM8547_005061 [Rhodosporidiobolus lusitaniae]
MQGFNKYYPPDYDPEKHSSLNSYHGKHALGDRARKIDEGILVVRFELPYNIWCGHCNAHVGQGVRYNAEKKRVGSYYSSAIWSFRFKCHLCSGWIEIRTDPQNTRYVVTQGARQKHEEADDPEADGMLVVDSTTSTSTAPPDPFAALEKNVTQQTRALSTSARLTALHEQNSTNWDDPFSASQRLRNSFRKKKKEILKSEEKAEGVRAKYGLGERISVETMRTPARGTREAEEEERAWEKARKEKEKMAKETGRKRRREEEEFDIRLGATPRPRSSSYSADKGKRRIAALPSSSSSSRRCSLPASSSTSSTAFPSPRLSSSSSSRSSPKPSLAAQALHSKLALASRLKSNPFASPSSLPSPASATRGLQSSRSAPAGLARLGLGSRLVEEDGGAGGREATGRVKVTKIG